MSRVVPENKRKDVINVVSSDERDRALIERVIARAVKARRTAKAEVLYELECFEKNVMKLENTEKGTEDGVQ